MTLKLTREQEALLSAPDTKKGKLQRICLAVLRVHERDGTIPTNSKFISYGLVQSGDIPKKPPPSQVRRPETAVHEALMRLRDKGIIPWNWLTEETRTFNDYTG